MIEKDKATNSVWEAFSQQNKDESNDMLPLHVLKSIAKGQADIIAGRMMNSKSNYLFQIHNMGISCGPGCTLILHGPYPLANGRYALPFLTKNSLN